MYRIHVFLVFLIIYSDTTTLAQCSGSFTLSTQEDIDSFQTKYGPCKEVGELKIDNTDGDIISLKPLLGIKKILTFKLSIGNSLFSLDGLDSLEFINAFYYESNHKIDTKGFENVDTIVALQHFFGGSNRDLLLYNKVKSVQLLITENSGSLEGMSSLGVYDGLLILIYNNDSIRGFDKLIPVGQKKLFGLILDNCNGSLSLKGLDRLESIGWLGLEESSIERFDNILPINKIIHLRIKHCNYSKEFNMIFSNIDTLNSFKFNDVKGLKDLSSILPNLKNVVESMYLIENNELVNIETIEYFQLPHTVLKEDYNIYIKDNPKLNYCNYDIFCRAINTYPDSILLEGNGEDCTYESISEFCKGYVPLTNIFDTICNGDYYKFGDFVFDEAGYYLDTLQDRQGEDSIVLALNLVINPSDSIYIDTLICQGNTVNIGEEEISEQGIYEFELQNHYGCDSLIVFDVKMSEMEIDTVEIIPDYGCDNGAILLTVEGNNPPFAFNWSNGDEGESIIGLLSGEYKVTITDKSNCEYETDNFIVSDSVAYMIPNMFFPGGAKDDINSTFKTYLGRDTKILSIEIYSRWGEKVFYAKDDTPWDGTYKGAQSAPGVYLYKIVIESPCGTKAETGQVMLLR